MHPRRVATALAGSFAGMGLFAASVGFSRDIDASTLRFAAALLILALGIVLLVPALQAALTRLPSLAQIDDPRRCGNPVGYLRDS
jgi:hypothetical protein